MDDKWHLFYELHWTSVRHKCGEAYVRLGTLGGYIDKLVQYG
jgi:hypothetical protein